MAAIRLEIGPGSNPLPGFKSLDFARTDVDYSARWGYEALPLETGSCREVYASHVLEHVPWNRTQRALAEVLRILEPGGLFEVWVPDFGYIVKCYTEQRCGDAWRRDNPTDDCMTWVNGRLFTYGPEAENWHHACFDAAHLRNQLLRAGFVAPTRIPKRQRGASHGPIDLGMSAKKAAA